MATYPMNFFARAESVSGLQTDWSATTGDDRSIRLSIPKEFEGPNSDFSPEDLFLLALANCYVATLKVIAANSNMSFASLHAEAKLTLDRDEGTSAPWMKRADLKFTVNGVQNVDRFQRLMERVSKQCMIINSVRTDVHFEFEVRPL